MNEQNIKQPNNDIFLSPNVKTIVFKKGEKLFDEGQKSIGICKIKEGMIVFKNVYSDGHEAIIKTAGPEEIFGEFLLFSSHPTYPASIYALSSGIIKYISNDDANKMLINNPLVTINLLKIISKKHTDLNLKMKLLNHKTLRSRICFYLCNEYRNKKSLTILIPFNRNDFANYLNVERPSLSRELSNMRNEHLIDFYKNSIKILDLLKIEQSI